MRRGVVALLTGPTLSAQEPRGEGRLQLGGRSVWSGGFGGRAAQRERGKFAHQILKCNDADQVVAFDDGNHGEAAASDAAQHRG